MRLIPVAAFSLFRVIFFSAVLWRLIDSHPSLMRKISESVHYNVLPSLALFGIDRLPANVFGWVYIALIIAVLVSIEGRWAKWSLPATAVLTFLIFATGLGFEKAADNPYVPHNLNAMMFFLILFAGLPGRYHATLRTVVSDFGRWRAPALSAAPLVLFRLSIAIVYFGAVVTRLRSSGLQWLDGSTLQAVFYERYALFNWPLLYDLAANRPLCQVLSTLVCALELGIIFTIFSSRAFLVALIGAAVFHVSAFYALGINYLNTHMLTFSLAIAEVGLIYSRRAKVSDRL